jgi:hypothetical protein
MALAVESASLDSPYFARRTGSMERFYTAHNRFDAYLVLHRLQQAGIAAHIFNEHMSSIVGEVPPDVAQPQVWLDDGRDRPRADAALAALRFDRAQTGSVFCRACKEENPASFELCWHCGANL